MSGNANVSGRIDISPPITWGEMHDKTWAHGGRAAGWPDAYIEQVSREENTATGKIIAIVGAAIILTEGESDGRNLVENLDRIVREFGTTPDGTRRTFTGWFESLWLGGGDDPLTRIYIDNATHVVLEVQPKMTWPQGARNEDAAEPKWPNR